jgi:hypothetical protein
VHSLHITCSTTPCYTPPHDHPPQAYIQQYLESDGSDIAWDFIRAAFQSVAKTSIVMMQVGADAGVVVVGRNRSRYMCASLITGLPCSGSLQNGCWGCAGAGHPASPAIGRLAPTLLAGHVLNRAARAN